MRFLFLFGTKFRFYLTEIPFIVLLKITLDYNRHAAGLLKLYPLIVCLCLGIVFVAVYFFRGVWISWEQICQIGLFSSRDRVTMAKGNILTLSVLPRHKLRVEVDGENDIEGTSLLLPQDRPRCINLFRAKAIGGVKTAGRVLSFFGVPKEEQSVFWEQEVPAREYDAVRVWSDTCNDQHCVHLLFTETL